MEPARRADPTRRSASCPPVRAFDITQVLRYSSAEYEALEGLANVAGVVDRLLRVPIFYKVLLANSLIVVIGAAIGTYLTGERVRANPQESQASISALFVLGGLLVSVVVNFVVLRLALLPLKALTEAVEEVRRGNFLARARKVRIGDPQVDELTDTLNAMLDEVETYRKEVRKLSSQAISAQEEERKRIARELHDETAQALTSLLVRLRIAERASTLEEIKAGIGAVRDLATRTLDEVRKMAVELRPSALDDLGLVPALQWYTKQYAEDHRVELEFHTEGFDQRLPADVELVLYRVIQEALTNVAKHSRARRVKVLVSREGDVAKATIQDDGRGFDVSDTLQSRERGLGLFGMQERLALVGGNLKIDSVVGIGTRVEAAVPPRQPAPDAPARQLSSATDEAEVVAGGSGAGG